MRTRIVILSFFALFACSKDVSMNCEGILASSENVLPEIKRLASAYSGDDIEFPINLIEQQSFREWINSPCKYKGQLASVLVDSSLIRPAKLIALYSLQRLCIDDYINILEILLKEFEKGSIDEAFFFNAVTQRGFSLEVSRNQSDEKLKSILNRSLMLVKNESRREFIQTLIDEKIDWKSVLDTYQDMGEKAPWVCGNKRASGAL